MQYDIVIDQRDILLQLLRGPNNPDPRAAATDIGLQHYRQTLLRGKGTRLRQSDRQTVSRPEQDERWNVPARQRAQLVRFAVD